MDVFRSARQNLRRHGEADMTDLERQQSRETQEMNEPQVRPSPISNVLRRIADLPRSSGPQPRQTTSRYDSSITGEIVSPKTPQYVGSTPSMTSMQLPSLQWLETRQDGANGPVASRLSQPPSYDDASRQYSEVAVPAAAVTAQRVRSQSAGSQASDRSERRRQQRRFDGADPAELHLADMAEDGRQRRRRRSQLQEQQQQQQSSSASAKARPKKFLFCFPYVRSHQMRAQILRCSVSALLLVLLVTMYLALMLTHNIHNNEFSVLLILIALAIFVLFCHSIIRIILMLVRPPSPEEEERYLQRRARAAGDGSLAGPFTYGTDLFTPGGYAIPRQPIRVVLARDEEAAGVESVAAKTQPPAYGLWRETVVRCASPNLLSYLVLY